MKEEKKKHEHYEEKIENQKDCKNHCDCGDDCDCGENCSCHEHENEKEKGGRCNCHHNHDEDECCSCHDHNHKNHYDEDCDCDEDDCKCKSNVAEQYLMMAQRLQADFDNYRKRVAEQLDFQREEGKKSVIEVFLPCLDTFKEAKKSIGDEKVLSGINMIEEKILDALRKLNVEKIESIGQVYDHNTMEVIAIMNDASKENDIILDEFQAGYTFNGKVIRYSKVIVNKLS